ncbi:hypothetical protein FGB62_100g14 [Gracilaria domingensis]|nr:hypothetical protein FGB62_100g14 [Gracilaria domingensis]
MPAAKILLRDVARIVQAVGTKVGEGKEKLWGSQPVKISECALRGGVQGVDQKENHVEHGEKGEQVEAGDGQRRKRQERQTQRVARRGGLRGQVMFGHAVPQLQQKQDKGEDAAHGKVEQRWSLHLDWGPP